MMLWEPTYESNEKPYMTTVTGHAHCPIKHEGTETEHVCRCDCVAASFDSRYSSHFMHSEEEGNSREPRVRLVLFIFCKYPYGSSYLRKCPFDGFQTTYISQSYKHVH